MLSQAGYDTHSQYSSLLFHQRMVVPSLGPRPSARGIPHNWRSFMTDDFSPLEYSWSWDAGGNPKIRYSIEAIGPDAGTVVDPFNRVQTMKMVDQLCGALPETDWQWFHHFADTLHKDEDVNSRNVDRGSNSSTQSSIFLTFEFDGLNVAVKAYFIPVKSAQTGEASLTIVTQAIESLNYPGAGITAHQDLHDFMLHNPLGTSLQIVGLSVDCVDPCRSRLKYYVRSPYTSFNSVCTILTLKDKIHSVEAHNGLDALRELWQLVFGLEDGFSPDEDLASKKHETAGVLYNFDIRPGVLSPEPKVYLPVKHYGRSDQHIAEGIVQFLRQHGRPQFVANYLRLLEDLCVHRALDSGCGLQTYISCAVKEGQLSLASYIGPEIYHPARWT
ncbi:hypothetical protein MMC28_008871 [Mycoblastus sanguinarius]|nr:hypothetical protein [Mycoblastus sanguinarius]